MSYLVAFVFALFPERLENLPLCNTFVARTIQAGLLACGVSKVRVTEMGKISFERGRSERY
jgi:hypothetical protein